MLANDCAFHRYLIKQLQILLAQHPPGSGLIAIFVLSWKFTKSWLTWCLVIKIYCERDKAITQTRYLSIIYLKKKTTWVATGTLYNVKDQGCTVPVEFGRDWMHCNHGDWLTAVYSVVYFITYPVVNLLCVIIIVYFRGLYWPLILCSTILKDCWCSWRPCSVFIFCSFALQMSCPLPGWE